MSNSTAKKPLYPVAAYHQQLKQLGLRVRLARQNRGLTQSELAQIIDISSKSVSAIEVGRIEASISQVQALAAALQEPLGYFVGENVSSIESRMDRVKQELDEVRRLMDVMSRQK
jgi:repressor LexA